MTERTFSIIKPDATRRNLTGAINAVIEGAGLRIVAQRRVHLTDAQAKKFYEVHAERPFYGELVGQMTAEPVVVQVLEGPNAVAAYREVMGATNPKDAADGTIRKLFAKSVGENSVHGSCGRSLIYGSCSRHCRWCWKKGVFSKGVPHEDPQRAKSVIFLARVVSHTMPSTAPRG